MHSRMTPSAPGSCGAYSARPIKTVRKSEGETGAGTVMTAPELAHTCRRNDHQAPIRPARRQAVHGRRRAFHPLSRQAKGPAAERGPCPQGQGDATDRGERRGNLPEDSAAKSTHCFRSGSSRPGTTLMKRNSDQRRGLYILAAKTCKAETLPRYFFGRRDGALSSAAFGTRSRCRDSAPASIR